MKLSDRISSYYEISNTKLLPKLPVVTIVNGRGFAKVTSLLEKPYSEKFSDAMSITSLKLCSEIEGAVMAYCFSDEIVVISRNDNTVNQQPWCDNRVQKISSMLSSIATHTFNKYSLKIDLNILNEAYFYAHTFVVPSVYEAINTIVCKQQQNYFSSVNFALYYEYLKKYNNLSTDLNSNTLSKIKSLKLNCDIDYNDYPESYKNGTACYRVPIQGTDGLKNKWIIDYKIPNVADNPSFLKNIIL